ncbi:DUF3859 domain-containing protein [Leptothermofonsia sp. ETS-13]|uniref:DUF3859 domain-containing protein n=1 Tax=Leptothermofonsia sp. ETS-13 TaxID=3035696 RepID=UPI003BA31470
MNNRLTQEQLGKIVGEVERLSQQRQNEVDREQMVQILQELNLPPELIDEAMIQVQRRDALAVQQRQTRRLIVGIAACLAVAIGGIAFWSQQNQQTLARVAVQQDRITLTQDDGSNLTTVSRPAEVVYRVTLKDAPVGKKLDLSCDWIGLGDQVLKQNRYQTKEITTPVWNTQCRNTIAANAPCRNLEGANVSGRSPTQRCQF